MPESWILMKPELNIFSAAQAELTCRSGFFFLVAEQEHGTRLRVECNKITD